MSSRRPTPPEPGPRPQLTAAIWLSVAVVIAGFAALSHRSERGAFAAGPARDAVAASGSRLAGAVHTDRLHVPRSPAALRGRVHDVSGKPVPAARVCASCSFPLCGPAGPAEIVCAESLADGTYALELAARRYQVTTSAAHYRPAVVQGDDGAPFVAISGSAPRQIDITLERGGATVVGRVVDVTGGPIAAASITVLSEASFAASLGCSDSDGRFELNLEPGPVTLRASAERYTWSDTAVIAPADQVELILAPESQAYGSVVSASDGKPIGGAEIRATKRSAVVLGPGDGSAASDAAGRFHIDGLSDGSYELTARAPGWFGRARERLRLGFATRAEPVRIEMHPAVSVEGLVTQPDDRPCPYGTVLLAATDAAPAQLPFAAVAAIDPEGRVSFPAVPPGRYQVEARCDQLASARDFPAIDVRDVDIRDLRWRLAPSTTIAGRVADTSGHGVANRRVLLVRVDDPALAASRAITRSEASGAFEFTGVSPGRYKVEVEGAPETAREVEPARANVASLVLTVESGGVIDVRVLAATGASPAAVRVSALGPSGDVDAESLGAGRFRLRDLIDGSYLVSVVDRRFQLASRAVEVRAGLHSDAVFELPRLAATLRGHVVDDRGAPVSDVWVRASPSSSTASGLEGRAVALSSSDGSFEIPNLLGGTLYDVEGEHDAAEAAELRGVSVDAPIVLTLRAGS